MHSAANRLADFAGRDRVNSATETQTPAAKTAAPRHSSGRIIFRYGLALGSVAAATAIGFLADRCDLHESVFTLFVLAVALTSWFAGVWPAVVAFGVGALAFNYYFTGPLYGISFTREDFAYLSVFALLSGLLIWFGIVRRRAEADLRQSRDELEMIPVVVLTSSHEERDLVKSYKLGVNGYVVKPVDFHQFVNAVKELGVFWAVINEPPPGSVKKR